MRPIAIVTALLPCVAIARGEEKFVLVLHSMRLYQPDDILRDRVGSDVDPLSNYVKALHRAAVQAWKSNPAGNAKGLLVAVGIRPDKSTRVWIDAVDGDVPADTLKALSASMEHVTPIQIRNGPVAFSMSLGIGSELPREFPVMPQEWRDVAQSANKSLAVPDGLFEVIWPAPHR